MSNTVFDRGLTPPNTKTVLVGGDGTLSIEGLAYFNELFSWVCGGYVIIPCDVGGTSEAIELRPRFRPERAAVGYSQLIAFSFVATADNVVDGPTVEVMGGPNGDIGLGALPLYSGSIPAGAGIVDIGVPYIVLFCEESGALPDRMVIK